MVKPGGNGVPENPVVGTSFVGPGVLGQSNTGVGVSGQSLGFADPHTPNRPPSDGVRGEGSNGVHGLGYQNGVLGECTGLSQGIGVKGTSTSGDGIQGTSTSRAHAGVAGINDSGGAGVAARGTPAGLFEGNIEVTGDISGPLWSQTVSRIAVLENQATALVNQLKGMSDQLNSLLSRADRQQPVLYNVDLAGLTVTKLAESPLKYRFEGRLAPNRNSVRLRVSNRSGSFFQEILVPKGTDSGGSVVAEVVLNLNVTEEPLFFAISDGTQSAADWTSLLWSNTVVPVGQ
jgi:hypothetical protein